MLQLTMGTCIVFALETYLFDHGFLVGYYLAIIGKLKERAPIIKAATTQSIQTTVSTDQTGIERDNFPKTANSDNTEASPSSTSSSSEENSSNLKTSESLKGSEIDKEGGDVKAPPNTSEESGPETDRGYETVDDDESSK